MQLIDKLLWGCILLAFIVSAVIGVQRIALEKNNLQVELVMDFTSLKDLARGEGLDEKKTAELFKGAGITGLSFNEDTLESLKQEGRLNWYAGKDLSRALQSGMEKLPAGVSLQNLPPVNAARLYVALYDHKVLSQLQLFIPIFCGNDRVNLWAGGDRVSHDSPAILEVIGNEKDLTTMGLGFSRESICSYRELGLNIVLRPENKSKVNKEMITEYAAVLSQFVPISAVIFTGPDNDVLGYPHYLDCTADLIDSLGCSVGMIEAPNVKAQQKGIQTVTRLCPDSVLRVQSIAPLHQEKLSIEDVIGKFELGVRERNMRLLYLRPFSNPYEDKSLLETNIIYFTNLKKALTSKGFTTGKALSLPGFTPPVTFIIILGCGVLAALLLGLRKITGKSDNILILIIGAWVVLLILFAFTGKLVMWRKLSALAGAITFPTLAFLLHFQLMKDGLRKNTFPALLLASSTVLFRITFLTFLGGLIVAGLLTSTEFLLQIDSFRGIKLLMTVPPVLITLLYFICASPERQKLLDMLKLPVYIWHLVILCVLGGAGSYYLLRTGNAPGDSTSAFELSMRSLLNDVLQVRPRFKEFLLAHPALMLLTGLLKTGRRQGAWILFLLAGIGQADIIDTLAHLHTPLLISIHRIMIGLLLGWFIGTIALLAFWLLTKKRVKAEN